MTSCMKYSQNAYHDLITRGVGSQQAPPTVIYFPDEAYIPQARQQVAVL